MAGRELLTGYFPVIHAGYLDMLGAFPEAEIGVLGDEVLQARFNYLRKDIRALSPEQAVDILQGINRQVRLVGRQGLVAAMQHEKLIMPDDEISRSLAQEFSVEPRLHPVFLRWDRDNVAVNQDVVPDRIVRIDAYDPLLQALFEQKERSTNWWRRVAAAVVNENDMLAIAHNSSVPTPYSSALDSDPRITAKRGESIETSIDMHAEARTIADLAKKGVATEGASIFVTTFPCPNCAKLIAESGITKCYFIEGYAMLDGQSILKASGIEIIKIDTEIPAEDPATLKPYPSS